MKQTFTWKAIQSLLLQENLWTLLFNQNFMLSLLSYETKNIDMLLRTMLMENKTICRWKSLTGCKELWELPRSMPSHESLCKLNKSFLKSMKDLLRSLRNSKRSLMDLSWIRLIKINLKDTQVRFRNSERKCTMSFYCLQHRLMKFLSFWLLWENLLFNIQLYLAMK